MMTAGGAPTPVKTGRSIGGIYCPSCGSHHAAGTLCGNKSVDEVIDLLKAVTNPGKKGGIPGHTGGNPFHGDDGRFTTENDAASKTPKVGKPAVPVESNKPAGGGRSHSEVMAILDQKKKDAAGPEPDLANMKQPGQPDKKIDMSPAAADLHFGENPPKSDLGRAMDVSNKKKRPVEYYNPDKPHGDSPKAAASPADEVDDFIPVEEGKPTARPEASTLKPSVNAATNPGSPVAKQPKKEFTPVPGMSPVAAAEKDFNPNPNDIGALSQHRANLKQQGVSDEEATASANKVAADYIANKKNKVVSSDQKPEVAGVMDNYNPGQPQVGNEPKVQIIPGMRNPVQFDSGAPPDSSFGSPAEDPFAVQNAGKAPSFSEMMAANPLSPPPGGAPGSGGLGGGPSGFASNTSGATGGLNNMNQTFAQQPQQPGMPIPFSQLYGAGASMGSGLGTPGGSAAPTAGFVAQRTHSLLNPSMNSGAGPAVAGPRYLGQPHLQSQTQTHKSLNSLQNWLNNRGK